MYGSIRMSKQKLAYRSSEAKIGARLSCIVERYGRGGKIDGVTQKIEDSTFTIQAAMLIMVL